MRDPKERLEDILEAIDNLRLRPGCLAKNRRTHATQCGMVFSCAPASRSTAMYPPQPTAAAGSAAPRPGEWFEAYHPGMRSTRDAIFEA
jgi:hypothetical protein